MSFGLLFWLAPIPYLAAWLTLSCPSLLRSTLSVLLLAIANAFVVYQGFYIGVHTLGLLALPAIVGGGYLIGLSLVPLQGIGGLDTGGAWRRIHGRGCLLASVALVFAFLHRLYTPLIPENVQPTALQSAGRSILIYLPVWLSFLWHARAAWAELRASQQVPPEPSRAGIVVLCACVLSFWLFAALPGGVSLMGGNQAAWVRPPPGTPACLPAEWP